MIRVTVPIDLNAVCTSGCPAFAMATPMRLDELVALAVETAVGRRAPADKRERNRRQTVAALRDGRFLVDVDGRIFSDPDAVIVCSGTTELRFFLKREVRSRR